MSPLYDILQQIHPLPAEFWDELNSTVTERDVPRKTRLLHQGAISNEIFFIIKGLARAYYFKNDVDVTSWFMRENDFIISVNSFFRRIPSQESIELLEDSRLISITYDQLHELYKKYVAFNFIGRVLTENYYILSEQRIYSMRMQTARERYELLQSTDPFIFQRVPLKYIASYLSMKPETLSRIRAAR
jgi:CRP/FNR family transcriptional regulator, anaerobic regulatory protein